MEYLDGLDLSRIVKLDGPQPAGRVISVLRQVCNSLSEAHESGLVHRDIKPANVILFRRGRRADIVKVLDFGLVHDVSEGDQSHRPHQLAGTPAYMAPESFHSPGSVCPRSDLYAVGALGYFLLTGRNVFEGSDFKTLSQQHQTTTPISPSTRLGRDVDPELSTLLMKCLEKEPQARPHSAAELSGELAACEAASTWSREDALRWWEILDRSKMDSDASETTNPDSEPPVTITQVL
jgi:serine/threonine protein kinase